jgi:hypothetical protein
VIGKIRKKIAMFTHPDRGASPEKIDLGKSLNAHLDLMEKSSSVIKNILSRNGI